MKVDLTRRRRRRRALPSVPEPGSAGPRSRRVRDPLHVSRHRADLVEPREPRARPRSSRSSPRRRCSGWRSAVGSPAYLGCEPTKDAVVAARDAALRADPDGLRPRSDGLGERRRRHRRRGLSAADDPARRLRGGARRRAGAPRRADRAVDRGRARDGDLRRHGREVRGARERRAGTTRGLSATRRSSRTGPAGHHVSVTERGGRRVRSLARRRLARDA